MIEAALVLGPHEEAILTHEDAGEIHRLIRAIRRAIGLEAVDAYLLWLVQVPAWLGPQRLDVAVVALRFATEELIAALRCRDIKIAARARAGRGDRELIELQRRQL